jgi:hypothetical protein
LNEYCVGSDRIGIAQSNGKRLSRLLLRFELRRFAIDDER